MSYDLKSIKTDVEGNPVPQHFDPTQDDYDPTRGRNGAMRVELYGPDGVPIQTYWDEYNNCKLAVKAPESDAYLATLNGKDFATQTTLAAVLAKLSSDPATQTTLAAVLAKMIAAPATEAKQDDILGYIDGLESSLTTLNGVDFATQTTLAAILTQLNATGLKKIIDPLPAGTNNIGDVDIASALPAGSNVIGKVGIDGSITPTHSAVTVGTSSGQALASNTSRKYALFINDSDAEIYLKIGSTATLNTGIRLNKGGGTYEMSPNIGNLATGAVNAISSAASKNLLVMEG